MATTRARRDSIVSHRRTPSLHSLEPAMPSQDFPGRSYPSLRLLSDSKHLSLSALSAMLLSNLRKWRIRGPLVALVVLLTLALFAILHQHLNDPQSGPPRSLQRQPVPRPLQRTARPKLNRPKIAMSPEQELAAVIAFMDALPSNALPDTVNVSYVDPDLILDFDTRSPIAPKELQQIVDDTWHRLPVVLLSEKYSPLAREIKTILGEYNLKPSPVVFDIDQRADVQVISPVLHRLTGQSSLPILLLGGKPAGSIITIRQLQKSGELRSMIAATTAVIDGVKRKKKGKRDV